MTGSVKLRLLFKASLPLCVADTSGTLCTSNPCKNGGNCTQNANGYACQCPLAYTGAHCETGKTEKCAFMLKGEVIVATKRSFPDFYRNPVLNTLSALFLFFHCIVNTFGHSFAARANESCCFFPGVLPCVRRFKQPKRETCSFLLFDSYTTVAPNLISVRWFGSVVAHTFISLCCRRDLFVSVLSVLLVSMCFM